MRIIVLGSGGFRSIPQPLCRCAICSQARKHESAVHAGPSYFLPELDLLIDTPAEIKQQIQRLGHFPKNVLYSHWHPDHTEGYRIFECYPQKPTLYLPKKSEILKHVPGVAYLQKTGRLTVRYITPGKKKILTNGFTVECITLTNTIPAYAYLFSNGTTRVLICPDHAKYLLAIPHEKLQSINLLIMNLGTPQKTKSVTSIEDNVEIVKRFKPKQTILAHIEEHFITKTTDRKRIKKRCHFMRATLAHDFQVINVPTK